MTNQLNPVVELNHVSRVFPGEPPVAALKDATLQIYAGEYIAIIGPSGSGKSTLLNLLGLLDRPTEGTYHLDGVEVGNLTEQQRTALRGQRIGFVFQSFHLLPHRSVLENVMLSQIYNRSDIANRKERSLQALERVGLSHRTTFQPNALSGGERQRVAIARALAGEPSLLLCDEPTGNLDTETSNAILDLFDDMHRSGVTLVIITHDLEVSERAERTVTMRDGVLSGELWSPLGNETPTLWDGADDVTN